MQITITVAPDKPMRLKTDEPSSTVELVGILEYAKHMLMSQKEESAEQVEEVKEG